MKVKDEPSQEELWKEYWKEIWGEVFSSFKPEKENQEKPVMACCKKEKSTTYELVDCLRDDLEVIGKSISKAQAKQIIADMMRKESRKLYSDDINAGEDIKHSTKIIFDEFFKQLKERVGVLSADQDSMKRTIAGDYKSRSEFEAGARKENQAVHACLDRLAKLFYDNQENITNINEKLDCELDEIKKFITWCEDAMKATVGYEQSACDEMKDLRSEIKELKGRVEKIEKTPVPSFDPWLVPYKYPDYPVNPCPTPCPNSEPWVVNITYSEPNKCHYTDTGMPIPISPVLESIKIDPVYCECPDTGKFGGWRIDEDGDIVCNNCKRIRTTKKRNKTIDACIFNR